MKLLVRPAPPSHSLRYSCFDNTHNFLKNLLWEHWPSYFFTLCFPYLEKVKVSLHSHVQLFGIPWTVACPTPCPWYSPGTHTGVRNISSLGISRTRDQTQVSWIINRFLPTEPLGKSRKSDSRGKQRWQKCYWRMVIKWWIKQQFWATMKYCHRDMIQLTLNELCVQWYRNNISQAGSTDLLQEYFLFCRYKRDTHE